jgi:hypothetical protein
MRYEKADQLKPEKLNGLIGKADCLRGLKFYSEAI